MKNDLTDRIPRDFRLDIRIVTLRRLNKILYYR